MKVLAIETSCDETAVAIVEKIGDQVSVCASVVSSQVDLHAKFGGVVPNLAAREHVINIIPVLEEAFQKAEATPDDIDALAVTQGPGLIPALLVGTTTAKTLSLVWGKPLIGIHHIEGHIYANFVASNQALGNDDSKFPLLALVVSGGHTQLMLMKDHFDYTILGETQDDAVGEAFDKVAKLLGLPYPGGPVVAKRADAFRLTSSTVRGEASRPRDGGVDDSTFSFPRPMIDSDDYHFSFSGLKTAVLYFLQKHEAEKNDESFIDAVCHEFQEAAVDVLVRKTERAIQEFHPKTVVIAGGVSANKYLRERLSALVAEHYPDTTFSMPEFQYSLDNAVMIGAAALFRLEHLSSEEREALQMNWKTLDASATLSIT